VTTTQTAPAADSAERFTLTYRALAVQHEHMDLNGDYLEYVWLPIIGPTATFIVRRFGRLLGEPDQRRRASVGRAALAAGIGVGDKGGRNSPLMRALDRLERFGFIDRDDLHISVTPVIRPVSAQMLDRLPGPSLAVHRAVTSSAA
jgi:hypothetical protein